MSTLKTHNLQSPDAASVNIALASNNGMVVAGISTFNNRVLIGTTIEGHADADDLTIGSATNTAGITIRTNTAGTGRLWFSDGTSGAAEYQGYVQYDHNSQILALGSGGSTTLQIDQSGNVYFLGSQTGNNRGVIYNHASAFGIYGSAHSGTDREIRFYSNFTSGSEKLRIQSGGNVMIGGNYASTNLGKLHVDGVIGIDDEGSGTSTLNIMTAANTRLKIQATSSISQILTQNGNPFTIKTDAGTGGGTPRVHIASDGKMGVNTTSPIGTLDVYDGTFVLSKPNASGNERNWRFVNNNVAAGNLGLQVSTAAAGSTFANLLEITKNGLIGIGEGTPDRRIHLKDPAQIKLESTGTGNWSGLEFMASSGTNNYDAYMGMQDSDGIFFIDNNSNGHDFRIDRDGRVTTPNTPSFAAYQAQSVWTVNGTMVFNSTRHNVGNHYSTSNGHFTAPVAGSYQFNFYSIYRGNHTSAWVSMYKNNARMVGGDIHFTTPSLGNNWHNVSFSQVIYLNVNDYIEMKSAQSTDWHGANWQCFSGYLLG